MQEFDPETLSANNGGEGKPVYIAHDGKVYDVSASKLWKTGTHMKRHASGQDLSTDILAAPHGPEVLERFPQVGALIKKEANERSLPPQIEELLERIPFLRRHPHPITVHFPIVFMNAPILFCTLYLITGVSSFETTAFHCLGAGIIMLIPAMLTGFFTWWVNYQARAMRAVIIKIVLSLLLLLLSITAFIWRLSKPEILSAMDASGILYFLLIFSLMVIVGIIGFYGGGLTFPHQASASKLES